MIEKIVQKRNLKDFSEIRENLAYWLSIPPEERITAIEHLRREHNGGSARLQRYACVIQRPQG